MINRKKIFKVITVVVTVVILLLAGYIIVGHLGLNDNLDFGAGAYYYADIPNFEKYTGDGIYESHLPLGIAILLFLAWGALMYFIWTKLDK